MPEFLLNFDTRPLEELDQFALLACQAYNYGNSTDWFGCFRGGIHGVHARLAAVRRHYYEVHAWIPAPRILADAEYHLAAIFFNMDSAMECMTFALNALGNPVAVAEFRDVTDERSLRRISPLDVLGDPTRTPPLNGLDGYANYFPTLQLHWQNNRSLIQRIVDQHDVSKHRETIFQGGGVRDDAPAEFYEGMGVANNDERKWQFQPMAEIILHPNPKSPKVTRVPTPVEEQIHLEPMATSFCDFMNTSARCAFADATAKINLAHDEFQR